MKLNGLFKTVFNESRDIFDEGKYMEMPDYVMKRFGLEVASFRDAQLVHMDELMIKWLYYDQGTDRTFVSHTHGALEVRGTMRFSYPDGLVYPFVLSFPSGVLNASREHRRPHYTAAVDLRIADAAAGQEQKQRVHVTLRAYVEQHVKANVLPAMVERSFRSGFARTLDLTMRARALAVPHRYKANDWFSGRCRGTEVIIEFPSVDAGQLRAQLNNRSVDRVRFENRADHYVTTFRVSFALLRLATDVTVNASGWTRVATDVHIELDRLHVNVVHCSSETADCPLYDLTVTVERLHVDSHGQFDTAVERMLERDLHRCVAQTVENGLQRAIDDIRSPPQQRRFESINGY